MRAKARSLAARIAAPGLLAASLLSASATHGAAQPAATDHGGNLQAYVADVARLNRQGRGKRIAGLCASACTTYLGVRHVCVEPSAELWFHAPHHPGTRRPDRAGALQMLAHYPPPVRQWAIASGALEQVGWRWRAMLTGAQLIDMGLRRCPD